LNQRSTPVSSLGRSVVAILAIGLLLRLVWALIVPVAPVSDSHAYEVFARNLVSCGTYGWQCDEPSAYWPPGTSMLYAALFKLAGPGYRAIIALNLALFVGTTWLTITLCDEWFGARAAAIAGLLLAVWPSQVQFTTVLASEQPFTFGLVGGLFLWTRVGWPRWRSALCAGLAFGVTSLIRPTALLIPGLLAGTDVMRTRKIGPIVSKALVVYAVLLAVVAPWAVRNSRVFGRMVLVSTNGGSNLWMGNHEAAQGGYTELPPEATAIHNEAARDEYLGQEAKRFIRRHPLQFLQLAVRRLVITHAGESIGVVWNEPGLSERFGPGAMKLLKLGNAAFWGLVMLAALAGAVMLARSAGVWSALIMPAVFLWAYFALVHALVVAQDRYHFPSIPFIAALAALAADRGLGHRKILATTQVGAVRLGAP
jgi:hypothetical protein